MCTVCDYTATPQFGQLDKLRANVMMMSQQKAIKPRTQDSQISRSSLGSSGADLGFLEWWGC